jgi:hypothetical protein
MEKMLSIVMYTLHPSYGRNYKIGGSWSKLTWAKSETPSPK